MSVTPSSGRPVNAPELSEFCGTVNKNAGRDFAICGPTMRVLESVARQVVAELGGAMVLSQRAIECISGSTVHLILARDAAAEALRGLQLNGALFVHLPDHWLPAGFEYFVICRGGEDFKSWDMWL